MRFIDPLGLCFSSVNIYGFSFDAFFTVGGGFDFGIYHDRNNGEIGLYLGVEGGSGFDFGPSLESGYADSVKALNGPYAVVEAGVGGVSANISQGTNGQRVTVGNIGADNGGIPTGHTGGGWRGSTRLWRYK